MSGLATCLARLEMFSEVYGRRIDFRDVAEKIRAFQQKSS